MLLVFTEDLRVFLGEHADGVVGFRAKDEVSLAVLVRGKRVRISEEELDSVPFKIQFFDDVWSQ